MTDIGVAVKCPNCGGNEYVGDLSSNVAICKFCRTTFLPKVDDENSSEKKIDNAELYFHTFKEKGQAKKYYAEAADLNPSNFRPWWGLAKVVTDNFVKLDIDSSEVQEVKGYIRKAELTAPRDVSKQIHDVYFKYKNDVYDYLSNSISKNQSELDEISKKIKIKTEELNQIESDYKSLNKNRSNRRFDGAASSLIMPMIISGIIFFYFACYTFK